MATTKPQEQTAAGLRQELETAERGFEEVLDRIKDGDRKVGPEDLEAAERRVRFARARLAGEERRKAEEAERERLARLELLEARAIKELDPEPVRKLREKAEKALSDYVAACVAHNRTIDEIATELSTLEPLPDGWALHSMNSGNTFTAAGRSVGRMRPMADVADIARKAYRSGVPHGFIDLEQPLD